MPPSCRRAEAERAARVWRAEGNRDIGCGQAPHGRCRGPRNACSEITAVTSAPTPRLSRLVGHQHLAGLPRGGEDRLGVEQVERARIEISMSSSSCSAACSASATLEP